MDMEDDDDEAPMRIVRNWKRPEERVAAAAAASTPAHDPSKFVVSPITGESWRDSSTDLK